MGREDEKGKHHRPFIIHGVEPKTKKKYLIPRWIPGYNETLQFYLPLVVEQLRTFQLKSSVHSMTLPLFLRKAEQPWQSVNCHR